MRSLRFTAIAAALSIVLIGAGCKKETPAPAANVPAASQPSGDANATPPSTNGRRLITLSMTELAKHSSSSDCWLLISGSIYNVTSYLPNHPGGAQRILQFCGRDATTAFATQGGEGDHSSDAQQQLASFRLGNLNATILLPD